MSTMFDTVLFKWSNKIQNVILCKYNKMMKPCCQPKFVSFLWCWPFHLFIVQWLVHKRDGGFPELHKTIGGWCCNSGILFTALRQSKTHQNISQNGKHGWHFTRSMPPQGGFVFGRTKCPSITTITALTMYTLHII